MVIILIYVHDLIITSDSHTRIKELKAMLRLKLKFSDLGDLKFFLGIAIMKTDVVMYILVQLKYTLDMV